jgi:WXG100 family type VII secretion target
MSGIKVTPEQLNALSGQVARGSGEIEGQLRALSNTVAPLVGGDWAGQAQQRFTALWDEWQRSAQGLKHALDGLSQLMGQAGTAYAQAETQIASSFQQ